MNTYYITVPHNDSGIKEYDVGLEESENMTVFTFSDDDYSELEDVFEAIAGTCGVLIEEYERATIEADRIEATLDVLTGIRENTILEKAMRLALRKHMPVYFDL